MRQTHETPASTRFSKASHNVREVRIWASAQLTPAIAAPFERGQRRADQYPSLRCQRNDSRAASDDSNTITAAT